MRLVVPTSTRRAPGLREHVGDPEAVADLDELPAGDDRLLPCRERGEREQQRGRVVVDDHGVLGAGEPAQDPGEVIVSGAAPPIEKIELEIRVPGGVANPLERRRRQRRPAEVRVKDDTGCVDDPPQVRSPEPGRERCGAVGDVSRLPPGRDLLTGHRERLARRRHRGVVRQLGEPR